jgi:hypothetical protein
MAKTKQVATGNRRRVLENGRDVENSDEEDDENMKPDELTGCYTAEMDPKAGPKVLTQAEQGGKRLTGDWQMKLLKKRPGRNVCGKEKNEGIGEDEAVKERAHPKKTKPPVSESPVLIQLDEKSNRRRLLRKSDVGRYVVRRYQGP